MLPASLTLKENMVYRILGFFLLVGLVMPPLVLSFLLGRCLAVGLKDKNKYGLAFMLHYLSYHLIFLYFFDDEASGSAIPAYTYYSLLLGILSLLLAFFTLFLYRLIHPNKFV